MDSIENTTDARATSPGYDDAGMRAFFAATSLVSGLDQALRRPYLTYGGTGEGAHESLLVAATVRDTIARCDGFAGVTGLIPFEQFFTDPIVTVPLPISTEDDTSFRNPLWKVPGMLWHPLAWLPYPQACRMPVAGPDGEVVLESLGEWAVRLAWELTATGLYDPERGWVDVLALHGIDIATAGGAERVAAWMSAGQRGDEILDAVDLSPWFAALDVIHEAGWSSRIASETYPIYQAAAWSVAARTLLEELDAGDAGAHGGDDVDLQQLDTISPLAYTYFEGMPQISELGNVAPYAALLDLADARGDGPKRSDPVTVLTGLARLREILVAIRESVRDAEAQLDLAERERATNLDHAASAFLSEASQ